MHTPPALPDDPFGDDILSDPRDFYRRLRDAGPVVHVEQSEGFDIIAVGRDSVARAIFENAEDFLNSRGGGILDVVVDEPFREPGVLQETDAPYHDRPRTVMTGIISPRNLRSMRSMFQEAADELVDRLLDLGEFDAQKDLAEAYPLRVIPDAIMGVQSGGRENLLRYSVFLFESMGPKTPRARAVLESTENVQGAIAWVTESTQRDKVAPGSFGSWVWEAAANGELTEKEAGLMVRSLIGAGVDTTIYALGNTVQALAADPAQWSLVSEQPESAKFAFEESMRWRSPVRQIWRTPARDIEVEGIPLRKDQKIMLVLGAANRDPERWGDDAESFDLRRDSSGHLSMGRGVHQCVGAPIARLEADVVLSTFARRVKSIEPTAAPVPHLNNTLLGWSSIPVRVTSK